jgi:hypothetical protein
MTSKPTHKRATRKLALTPAAPLSPGCIIDRAADVMLALGRIATVKRLSHLAAELRDAEARAMDLTPEWRA